MPSDKKIKKPAVELQEDDITIDFSMHVSLVDEHVVEINGIVKDMDSEEEIGILRLHQLNLGLAQDEGEYWGNLIDSVDDDFFKVCKPIINTKRRTGFSEEFEDMLDDDDFEEPPRTLMVISKVGIYKDYRGNNLLGSILKMIRLLNPDAPIIAHPFPLQYNGNEENLKIMGIKSEKKATKEIWLKEVHKLKKHYEKHGFKQLGDSDSFVCLKRSTCGDPPESPEAFQETQEEKEGKMFKIELTFLVPDEDIRFEKDYVLYEDGEPSCIHESSSNIKEGEEKIIEGVKYIAKDPCPHLPNVIDGTKYKTLTEQEKDFYWYAEGEYLFDYKDSGTYYPTDSRQ